MIGASLVQIKELLRYLGRVITETAASFERVPFAEAVCGSVLIGYSALGFFFVYLLTRLFLVRAFNDVEKQLERRRYARMMKTMRGEYDFSDAEKHWLKILFASGGTNYRLEIPSDAFTANDEAAITALSERGLVEGIAGPWIPGATVKLTQLGVERQSMLQERVSS